MLQPKSAGLSRRQLLAAAGASMVVPMIDSAAISAHGAESVVLDSSIQPIIEEWNANRNRHPHIGDFRFAGFHHGKEQPPRTHARVLDAADYGAVPGVDSDQSRKIQAALDAAGAAGGALVRLSGGTYRCDSPLFVRDSGVILQGAGTALTDLFFTRPLESSVGLNKESSGSSRWSWTGGQVFIASRARMARSVADRWAGHEGWLPGEVLATVGPAVRGAWELDVSSSAGIVPGQVVVLEVVNDRTDCALLREMSGDVPGAASYPWASRGAMISPSASRLPDFSSMLWPVEVYSVRSATRIKLRQSLRIALDAGWTVRLRAAGDTVRNSGVEELTIRNKVATQTSHLHHPGANGVCFHAVVDCWARNVSVLNADVAFALTGAKSCTLDGIRMGGRAGHHFVACRVQSHDNMIQNFTVERFSTPLVTGATFHGLNFEGLSSGNVYRRGTMASGTFDSHRQLPFENLRTAITLNNAGNVGGADTAGPRYGARNCHWGIAVTNGSGYAMDVVGVAPYALSAGISGITGSSALQADFSGELYGRRVASGQNLNSNDLVEIQLKVAPPT